MNFSKIINFALLPLIAVLALSGCAGSANKKPEDADIVDISYRAADLLMEQAGQKIRDDSNTIVASYADINDLTTSSPLGRIAAQQVASRFTQQGYKVTEMLLRKDVYIREHEGEFILSRSLKNISSEYDVEQVLVGTYAVASHNIYITAKLVRVSDSEILSSVDYILPLGPDTTKLIRK
ncbi:MAG: FlgO family outer membrane protein [Parahaliea sp.]